MTSGIYLQSDLPLPPIEKRLTKVAMALGIPNTFVCGRGERAREKWKAIELHIRREVGQLLLLPSFLASCFPSIGDYIRQDMRRGGARCRGGGDDHMRPWRSRELVRA